MSFSEGPDAGLALLDTLNLDASLGEYHILHAIRADLLRRLGRPPDALPHYRRALELAPSDPECRILQGRLEEFGGKASAKGVSEQNVARPNAPYITE